MKSRDSYYGFTWSAALWSASLLAGLIAAGWAEHVFAAPAKNESAAGKPKPAKDASSLDDELLRDLEDEPTTMPEETAPAKEPAPNPQSTKEKEPKASKPTDKAKTTSEPVDELDRQLLEDLDSPDAPADDDQPLGQIGGKMRRARALIDRRQPGQQVQDLQREIVTDIEKLLEAARQRSKASSSSSQSSKQQQARREQAQQPSSQPASTGGQGQASNAPARDSDAQLQSRRAEKPDRQMTRDLIQELWGHLPQRDRQQVIQPNVETFVPKYDLMIREYFKRLAENVRGDGDR